MDVVPSLIGLGAHKISICQGLAIMALKMGALQFSYIKPWTVSVAMFTIGVNLSKMSGTNLNFQAFFWALLESYFWLYYVLVECKLGKYPKQMQFLMKKT
jgi:hypothetical protein